MPGLQELQAGSDRRFTELLRLLPRISPCYRWRRERPRASLAPRTPTTVVRAALYWNPNRLNCSGDC